MSPRSYTRLVRFSTLGVQDSPDDLTVTVPLTRDGYPELGSDFVAQVQQHVERALAEPRVLVVEAHPDVREGRVYSRSSSERAADRFLVAEFTVSIPSAPVPVERRPMVLRKPEPPLPDFS